MTCAQGDELTYGSQITSGHWECDVSTNDSINNCNIQHHLSISFTNCVAGWTEAYDQNYEEEGKEVRRGELEGRTR